MHMPLAELIMQVSAATVTKAATASPSTEVMLRPLETEQALGLVEALMVVVTPSP